MLFVRVSMLILAWSSHSGSAACFDPYVCCVADLAFIQKKKEEEKQLKALKEQVMPCSLSGCQAGACFLLACSAPPINCVTNISARLKSTACLYTDACWLAQAKKGAIGGAGLKKSGK